MSAAPTTVTPVPPQGPVLRRAPEAPEVLDVGDLRGELGAVATFVQFSSGFCAPCRATRRVLERVVGTTEGVAHVEVDVAQRPDLAGELAVVVTPTVLLLDATGIVVARAEGVPALAQARAAVAALSGRELPAGG